MTGRFLALHVPAEVPPWMAVCLARLRDQGMHRVDQVTQAEVDFTLDFGVAPAARSDAPTPAGPFGLWAFRFYDPTRGAQSEPGAAEICAGDPVTRAALVRVDMAANADEVLREGRFKTEFHSLRETQDAVYAACSRWPAAVLADVRAGIGPQASHPWPHAAVVDPPAARVRALTLRHSFAARVRALFRHEHWNVGFVNAPIGDVGVRGGRPAVAWLPQPPRGEFFADPFSLDAHEAPTIVCEQLDMRDGLGTLAVGTVDAAAGCWAPHGLLRTGSHLSYPYIVTDDDGLWCCPESSAAGEVALYKVQSEPLRLERAATLLADFPGVDPTIVRHRGSWWLLCTHAAAPNHELHVFVADRLLGPWRPHDRNPVKEDIRSARPAGTPWIVGGELFRPAQDCSTAYGARVAINRVISLTPSEFDEETVTHVEPDPRGPYPDGLHTLSAFGGRTLVDGKHHRFSPAQFGAVLGRYARRAVRAGRANRPEPS